MALNNFRSNETRPNDVWPPEAIDDAAEVASRKRKRHREWSGGFLLLLAGLVGLLAGRLGVLWTRFDVFAQFSIQFSILAVAGAVGLLSPRLKGTVAGLVAVLLVFAYGAWPSIDYAKFEKPLVEGEKRLKVAQFNLGGERSNAPAIVSSLRAMDADVVSLVETGSNREDLLTQLKTDYPYQVNCNDTSGCELAIVSKFPLSNFSLSMPAQSVPLIKVSLGADYGGLVVVALHTTRFPHITEQFSQFRAIAKSLESESRQLLVMGDFNATPQSHGLQGFAQHLGLSINTDLPSWPATYGLPQLAIDHILTNPSLRVLAREQAGQSAGSDHLPVALVLGVTPQAR